MQQIQHNIQKNQNKNNKHPRKRGFLQETHELTSGILQERNSGNKCFEVIFNLETLTQTQKYNPIWKD